MLMSSNFKFIALPVLVLSTFEVILPLNSCTHGSNSALHATLFHFAVVWAALTF